MKSIKTIKLMLLFLCLPGMLLMSQIVGNPIGSAGEGEWTMSLSGSFMRQGVSKEMAYSQRILLKSTFGITPWLDLNGMIGASDLRLDASEDDVEDFKDDFSFAYGLGLMVTPVRETADSPFGVFVGANIFRFHPEGAFNESVFLPSGELILRREFKLKYDWREICGIGGVSYSLDRMRIYLGGVGWMISRLDKKADYDHNYNNGVEENVIFVKEINTELQSDLWTGVVGGIEFKFPEHRYSLTLEGIFYNSQYYRIMVGISQTGTSMGSW